MKIKLRIMGVFAVMAIMVFFALPNAMPASALPAPAWTYYPSANDGYFKLFIPHHGNQPSTEITIFNDGHSIGPQLTYALDWFARTSDFNNPTYYGSGHYHNATKWLWNATIKEVDIVVIFDPRYVDTSPQLQLKFTPDGGTTWYSSPNYAPKSVINTGGVVYWNATANTGSNASALLTELYSPNFIVECAISNLANEYTPIDYLGFQVEWTQWNSWNYTITGPQTPGTGPTPNLFPSFGGSFVVKAITISMGLIGLVGMIAYPAAAIKAHKKGSDPGNSIINFLFLECIFIGMLYAALVIG